MIRLELSRATWRKSSHSSSQAGECIEVATVWRRSSHSDSGEGTCIEVAPVWRKSSRSGSQADECIEVATVWCKSSRNIKVAAARPVVAVRDSKDPGGAVLAFSPGEWRGLLEAIKAD